MTNETVFDNMMKLHVTREMLRWHVGQQMFCPVCNVILDVRRAVEWDLYKGETLIRSYCLCSACYDAKVPALAAKLSAELRAETTDGRILYAPTNETAPVDPYPIHKGYVEIGKRYEIRHSSGWITVRVVGFKAKDIYNSTGTKRQYRCINERTGREIVVKSAAKFRREVK